MPTEPIVITGAGMITCLGLDRRATWAAVRAGRCGMRPLTAMEQPLPAGKDGGQAPDLPADESPDQPREVRYLRRAMIDALADAGVPRNELPYPSIRTGVVLGTTLHGMRAAGEYLRSGSDEPLSRFLAGSTLRAASHGLGLDGYAATTCSACSSALGAVALGVTLLREGKLDLVLAGGYDPISEYVYAGFNSLRLVADGPLRPFARDRKGMKLAEGYAVVVLERADDAARRNAKAMATILGFGESADAHHLTQPHPTGEGASRAIRAALAMSGRSPADIDLVVAHATGTPDNDAGEYQAVAGAFGDDLSRVPVVGFKSHVGHTLGGAGAVELILAATAMAEGTIPPCANVAAGDSDFAGLNVATGAARPATVRATLSLSLGFGGANTAMILGPPPSAAAALTPHVAGHGGDLRDACITGIGIVLPNAIGNVAFLDMLRRPATDPRDVADVGPISDEQIAGLINARRVRRMSGYVKLTLAAAALAFKDAGIADVPAFCEPAAAVLGTTHGSTAFSNEYYRQIVLEGVNAANPLLFAEGVPNAAAAHLSLMMAVKGACQTIIGSRTSGLDALRLAAARIAQGVWDRALVGAGEEYSSIVNGIYTNCRHARAATDVDPNLRADPAGRRFGVGCGAVMLILESRRSLEARGGRSHGRVVSAASASPGRPDPAAAARVIADLSDGAFGPLDELLWSESGLWLDRVESRGMNLLNGRRPPVVSSLYGRVAECFSAGPLAGVAAAVLNGGAAAGGNSRSLGVVCTDVTGVVTGVRVARD